VPRERPAVALDVTTAAVAGAASLVAEFAAVRVLAPWFGQSNLVWANAVGVVLAALAIGIAVGGRAADGPRAGAFLTLGLGAAALLLTVAAHAAPALGEALAPVRLAGDRPLVLSLTGSLVGLVATVGLPCIALGAAVPILFTRLARGVGAGRAAGLVAAAGSLGSLAGTYAAPLLLVPTLGSRGAMHAAAAALALFAAAHAMRREGGPAGASPAAPFLPKPLPLSLRPGARRASVLWLSTAALVVGLVITGVEFAAVRALAPAFGQSVPVWANVVGVVLAALAAGNALGGRVAHRGGGAAALAAALVVASITLLLAAFLAPSLARSIARGAADAGLGVELSSLAATALCFGVPMIALGVASPLLVTRLARDVPFGRASGTVLAVGTLGSLIGCYAAPLAALPSLGTRATLICAASLVAFCAVGSAAAARPSRAAGVAS
jgi:hypothetical protein